MFGVPWCFWSQNLVLLCRNLHAAMFESVLRAPMSFFQDTPQARGILEKCRVWMIPRFGMMIHFGYTTGRVTCKTSADQLRQRVIP